MKTKLILPLFLILALGACQTKTSTNTDSNTRETGFVIRRGVNASHWLSQTQKRGEERARYMTERDFEVISALGFDHVRIPFDEVQMWDEAGNKHEDAFVLLHNAIKWSFANDLRVIVDLHILRSHHFNADDKRLWTDPAAQERFWGFWEQLSAELREYPVDKLAYELLNEAVADDPDDWNNLIAKGIEVVRKNEPERLIVVGSNRWQQVGTFKDLKIPENDPNLILSFHFYEPFLLTHHQAPWSRNIRDYKGEVNYPGYTVDTIMYEELSGEIRETVKNRNGYWDKERIEEEFMKARVVADQYGLPLYCGEFGCYPTTPIEIRQEYYDDIVSVFDKLDIAWTHWNYKNDFPVVDEETLEPIELVVSALMQ